MQQQADTPVNYGTDTDGPLPNKERGCGFLEPGKLYLRGLGGSGSGLLPAFVMTNPHIPYREIGTDGSFTRGFEKFDGLTFQVQTSQDATRYVPLSGGSYETIEAAEKGYKSAYGNMVRVGMYDTEMHVPDREVERHIDRVNIHGERAGDHFAAIQTAEPIDLFMRVGESYYPDPQDFILEAVQQAVSKAIPLSQNGEPPAVEPGITRLWLMHPAAGGDEYGGGIIGYTYLDQPVFTEPEDGSVPGYVQDLAETGQLDVREIGEQIPDEDDDGDGDAPNATIADYQE